MKSTKKMILAMLIVLLFSVSTVSAVRLSESLMELRHHEAVDLTYSEIETSCCGITPYPLIVPQITIPSPDMVSDELRPPPTWNQRIRPEKSQLEQWYDSIGAGWGMQI